MNIFFSDIWGVNQNFLLFHSFFHSITVRLLAPTLSPSMEILRRFTSTRARWCLSAPSGTRRPSTRAGHAPWTGWRYRQRPRGTKGGRQCRCGRPWTRGRSDLGGGHMQQPLCGNTKHKEDNPCSMAIALGPWWRRQQITSTGRWYTRPLGNASRGDHEEGRGGPAPRIGDAADGNPDH